MSTLLPAPEPQTATPPSTEQGPSLVRHRGQSVIALVLAAILPVGIALAFVIYLLNEEYRAQNEEELAGMVSDVATATDRELGHALHLASSFAVAETVLNGEFTRFHTEAERLRRLWPNVAAILVTDVETGLYLAHTSLAAGQVQVAGPTALAESRIVAQERKAIIFPVRTAGPTVQGSIIPIRAPIFRGDGQVSHVLSITLSVAGLNDLFAQRGIKPEWTGALIGPDFRIAARNRAADQFIGRRITPSLEQALQANPSGLFKTTNLEGEQVLTAYTRSPETGWTVAIGIPVADVEGRRANALRLVILFGSLAGLTGLGAALYVGKRIHRARMFEHNLTRHLEEQVAERTAELQRNEALLRQAQKMEAVGKLTSGIAHDFNNLLGVVIGNLDLIQEGLGDKPKLMPRIAQALEAAERGAALIQQLLAFSRKQTLQPQAIELAGLVERMAHMLRHTLGERIRLKVECDRPLWPCFIDPAQVESALLNLAINARDAMAKGGTLTIEVRNVALETEALARSRDVPAGRYVVVRVTDTGTGMTPEVKSRAVEPFFTTKDTGKGSGLGLSMVYGLATQSKGFFDLRSEPGQGTTIELGFPVATTEARATPEPAVETRVAQGDGKTMLLVEDNPRLRATTATMLRQIGYRPLEAGNSEEALAILASHPEIDLIVSDVILPGDRNGFELTAEAARLRPNLLALHVSGYADVDSLTDRNGQGAIRLLNKPFRTQELAKAIAEIEMRRSA